MSRLNFIEGQRLEQEFGMSSGYVLEFSNRTFDEFFTEIVGVSIFDTTYNQGSGSKANRMRAFWRVGTDDQVISCLNGLIAGWDIYANTPLKDTTRNLLNSIILKLGGSIPNAEAYSKEQEVNSINKKLSQRLFEELINLSGLSSQSRGFKFEKFLENLFAAYGLSPMPSFRLTGEQIDGSFALNHETYLLEAKWQNKPTGAADLHVFEGKLSQKASWSRGLFISNSGFSTEGLEAFGKGKRLVCMDGFDLSEMLNKQLSIVDVLEKKVRRAAETGRPYISIRELFS